MSYFESKSTMRRRLARIGALGALIVLFMSLNGVDSALGHEPPAGDAALASAGQMLAKDPVLRDARAAEPPLLPTPQGPCGPGSRPETGIQGRVNPDDHTSGRAALGFTCNTEAVGQYRIPNAIGTVGGFKVERYVDSSGHECAYYDTTLMWPTNALDSQAGVNVLDMADPANPVLTARLVTVAMNTPHESLVLSQKRGLLMAVAGNLGTAPGIVDIYDISGDCRTPVLKSSTPLGVLGHESGLSPDGNTFYSASPGSKTLVALDISNPTVPVPLWVGNYDSHGLSLSDDGNRAYVAGTGSGLIILDTSEVQSRVLNPTVRVVSTLQWASMSIPQNAIPITIQGHPYLVEIDEFGAQSEVGAGRIIDIGDETAPRVISNLRLAVHQPENFAAQAGDNGAQNPVQGYAGHYCNVPTRVDPTIVACSMILSGLRVFDIRDPYNPKEIAYFNAPEDPRIIPPAGVNPPESNWAMSSPSFVPARNEIWYSDGLSGFYNVRLTNGVWPANAAGPADEARPAACGSIRRGTRAPEKLLGTALGDRIFGRGGRDRIAGAAGDDCLRGNAGDDRVSGGAGADFVSGNKGSDRLKGGPGRDVLAGRNGNDLLKAADGERDRVRCGRGKLDRAVVDRLDRVSECERVRRS